MLEIKLFLDHGWVIKQIVWLCRAHVLDLILVFDRKEIILRLIFKFSFKLWKVKCKWLAFLIVLNSFHY